METELQIVEDVCSSRRNVDWHEEKVISRQSFGFDKESNHFVDRHYIPLNNLPYIERYGQLIFIFSFRKMGEI